MLMHLIAYFVLVVFITLFASSYFTYKYFSTSFKSEITDFNHKVLNQVSTISDEFILKNVNELAINQIMNISKSSELDAVFNKPSIDDWKIIFNAQYKLAELAFQRRDVVDSVFIHSRANHYLVSSSSKLIKNIDEKTITATDEFSWINTFYKSNKSLVWLKTRNTRVYTYEDRDMGDVITVICSYPTSAIGDAVKGFIAINIKEEALSSYLTKFGSSNYGQFMIIDSDGMIVSHSNKSCLYNNISSEQFVKTILASEKPADFRTVYNGSEYVVSYKKSVYNKWYYVSMIPAELFYQKDDFIRKKIFIVSIVILFIVLILSNILSYNVYIPLRKILDKYSKATGSCNIRKKGFYEYNLLDSLFSNMCTQLTDLRSTLDKNSLMIRHNFLVDLLNNNFNSPEGLDYTLTLLGINLKNELYCAVVFTYTNDIDPFGRNNLQLYKYSIIDYIDTLSSDDYICLPVDIKKDWICVIVNMANGQSEGIAQFVSQVQQYCSKKLNIQIAAGIGECTNNLQQIYKSYVDARVCIQYKFITPHENSFYYDEISKKTNSIPVDYTDKFYKNLKLGSYNDIKETLDSFMNTVITGDIAYREVRHTISCFTSAYIKYLELMNITQESIMDEQTKILLQTPHSMGEFLSVLLSSVQASINYINNKKLNKNTGLVDKIKQYVMNNLDKEISLNLAADTFYISSFYLSKIFKEETGINYIDYVITCKMDKAKDLLIKTNFTIDRITSLIGYSHATYFSRKFKEFTGKTPIEYRNDAHISA
jgi:Response regulator containing CheY-like receiver domain and AraC-type DNA-binding domain